MACTRVVYLGYNDVMTARSMDWKQETGTDLWILPSHVKRTGLAGPNSIQWISNMAASLPQVMMLLPQMVLMKKG